MRAIIAGWIIACLACGPVLATDTVTTCGHDDYPPWNWHKDGKTVGVCAEVAEIVFARLGLKATNDYIGPWNRCQKYVESGKIDVNICAFVNDARQEYATFTRNPMGINEIAVFVPRGAEFEFDTLEDLVGKRAIMLNGVSVGQDTDAFLETNTTLQRLDTRLQAFRFLDAGRADFLVTGKEIGLLQRDLHGYRDRITTLPEPIVHGPLHISLSNRSPYLDHLEDIDRILAEPGYLAMVDDLLDKYKRIYLEENREN
ncbi:transporter substrate-binding domain-containing protein [Labrenzia sp. 011]|uniref:substrate-binding periplasmic protein n=1 Tax=Labrenzia sp. 011 TaxID=2171494 RepID=UPI000D51F12A|nr:transporter substrate-binding domain-containing protein [Labrenzia sp. 011]PVB63048.1 amino acid-binding protein [Labrenzia sp. 011]